MHNKNKTFDFYIKQAWHAIYKMYNAIADDYNLTQAMGHVLLTIPKNGIMATQIGPEVGIEPTSLSRMLKRMEEKNLIYRIADKKDKRKVKVLLTEKGLEKRKITKKVVKGFDQLVKQNIPQEELEKYIETSKKIIYLADIYKKQKKIKNKVV